MAYLEYLKVEQLKEGYLYRIVARNAGYGIWFPEEHGFVIRRTKFNDTFLFTELHWDVSNDFGTARPIMEIEKAPFEWTDIGEKEPAMLKWLADRTEYWEDYV